MEFHLDTDPALLCRICMKNTPQTDTYTSIYSPSSNPDQPTLYSMLSAICAPVFSVPVEVDGHDLKASLVMPQSVCPDCKTAIESAYDLHSQCIETDRKLLEMIMIKQERKETVGCEDPLSGIEDEDSIAVQKIDESADEAGDTVDNEYVSAEEEYLPNPVKRKRGQSDESKRTCKFCSEVQKSKAALKTHIAEVHPETVNKCEICKKSFASKTLLESHKLGHATGQLRVCPFCPKQFKSYSGLREHKVKHTDQVQSKTFECSLCDKIFFKKNALDTHILRHTGEKPYACELCPSRFCTKGEVGVHMSTHTKQRNHVCEICGSQFTRNLSLVYHVKSVHSGDRKFACTVCNMRFKTADHLNRHMRTHTGEKPFQCAYCDRAYAQSGDLVKHSRIHVGANPYSCDRCDATFRLMTELRNHYKDHKTEADHDSGNADLTDRVGQRTLVFTTQATLKRQFDREQMLSAEKAQESTS